MQTTSTLFIFPPSQLYMMTTKQQQAYQAEEQKQKESSIQKVDLQEENLRFSNNEEEDSPDSNFACYRCSQRFIAEEIYEHLEKVHGLSRDLKQHENESKKIYFINQRQENSKNQDNYENGQQYQPSERSKKKRRILKKKLKNNKEYSKQEYQTARMSIKYPLKTKNKFEKITRRTIRKVQSQNNIEEHINKPSQQVANNVEASTPYRHQDMPVNGSLCLETLIIIQTPVQPKQNQMKNISEQNLAEKPQRSMPNSGFCFHKFDTARDIELVKVQENNLVGQPVHTLCQLMQKKGQIMRAEQQDKGSSRQAQQQLRKQEYQQQIQEQQ